MHITGQENGDYQVELNWNKVDFADGYVLIYANYKDLQDVHRVDLGQTLVLKTTLPKTATYWATIAAYNADGMSGIGKIHPVVAATPTLSMPKVTFQREGAELLLSWEAVPEAVGYRIRYGNQADLSRSAVIEIRDTQYQLRLNPQQMYFVGISAYNGTQESLMSLRAYQDQRRVVALIHQAVEKQGLQDGLKRFQKSWQGIPLDIVTWDSAATLMAQVEGEMRTQNSRRGLLHDPEILALITTTTESTQQVLQNQAARQLLTVAMSAPSTLLQEYQNLIQIPASHAKQARTLHNFLQQRAHTGQQMNRYVILIEAETKKLPQYFDLYLNVLKTAFEVETAVPLSAANQPFSQLLATLSLDGEASLQRIVSTVNFLKPDTVLYLGSAERFRQLYPNLSVPYWLLGDSCDSLMQLDETFNAVTVATLGSPGQIAGQNVYFSAYDTVGLLGHVFENIDNLSRATVLKGAQQLEKTPYFGITGRKSLSETDETGWYDLFNFTQEGWRRE
jgi:hypothetical protein